MKRKVCAMLTAVALCVGMLPTSVLAATPDDTATPLSESVEFDDTGSLENVGDESAAAGDVGADLYDEPDESGYEEGSDQEGSDSGEDGFYEEIIPDGTESDASEAIDDAESGDVEIDEEAENEEDEEEEEDENGIMLLSDPNLSVVDSLIVSSIKDGTEPFDDDDSTGNDSSGSNNIVRSFDNIEYNLGFTTALKSSLEGSVEDGNLMVEFTLYQDPSVAEFDMSTLNWCLDPVVTYYYADGTNSTTWDTSKTVTSQVLTGYRHIASTDGDAIPGSGSLTVGIYVKAASNGTTIQPTFTLYMEGNDVATEAKTIQPDVVTVTAAPRYNIRLYRNTLCDALGYFNLTDGTMSSTKSSDNDVYGRIEGYGITVQLYNDSADKGLKGVELPAGQITFDVDLTTTVGGTDMTAEDGYHPLLWDYEEATAESASKKGHLGRTMAAFGVSRASYAYLTPGNKRGQTDRYCYDGGGWSITQNSDYSLSVTLDGSYLFDEENFVFPEYGLGDTSTTPRFGANVGSFSAGYFQVIAAFPENAAQESTQNFQFGVEVVSGDNGMKVTSVSGQTPTAEMTYEDNKSTSTLTVYPAGSISKWNWYRNSSGNALDNDGSSQDGSCYGYQGEDIEIASEIKYTGDLPLTGYNILQKFDDEALEVVPTEGTGYDHYTNVNSNSKYDSVTVLYAAKPDGTGWSSDAEMIAAHEENLIYFTSLDALESAGYTCVGFLYEVRGTFYAMPGTGNYIYMKMKILDDAEIGSVYQTVNTARAWVQGTEEPISWTSVSYGNGACGWGDTSWTTGSDYYEGYTTPTYIAPHENDYEKTSYDNGSISGHTNANQAGDSLLIIGDKTTVSITVADTTETSSGGETAKTVYDLDQGERTVTYEVTPAISVVSANQEVESSNDTDNVTLTVTLPKGLSYDMGSAEVVPDSVTVNEDGTTTIVWKYDNVKVATDSLESFKFTCTIGEAGTADDVNNGDTLTITAEITSDKDNRESKSSYGNISQTTISVIRLAASSISKTVESAYSEVGQDVIFHLRYGNTSDSEQIDDELLDVLPYNGDGRNTKISGSYQVSKVTVDMSQAANTWAKDQEDPTNHTVYIEYSKGTGIRSLTEDQVESLMEGVIETGDLSVYGFTTLTEGEGDVDSDSKTITWDLSNKNITDVTALYIRLDDIFQNEYVTVSITLTVLDENGDLLKNSEGSTQQPGDVFGNDFYQYYLSEAGVVTSNIARCTVVERELSGRTWIDANKNGLQDSDEAALSNVTVTLYQETDDTDPTGIRPYAEQRAVNVLGETIAPATTDANGEYSFDLLPAGNYRVEFSNVNGNKYELTKDNVGNDDTIDSDATYVSNVGGDLVAQISNVELPKIEDMTHDQYLSEHNDAGYYDITIDIEGNKEWDDEDDQDGLRPDYIEVYLLADGERISDGHGGNLVRHVTPDADGNWTFKFTDLVKCNADGTEIAYTIEEVSVTGYTTTVTELTETEEGSGVYTLTITNKHTPETINISGEKVWDDADNQDGIRPGSVTINLLADGEPALDENGDAITATVTSDDDWEFSFTDLPKYKDGTEIQYNITEDAVDDYSTKITITKDEETGDYTVSVDNSYTPEQTSLPVIKVWDDDNNADGFRPESITVKLLANGEDTGKTLTLDESNNWQGSFTELDVNTPVGQKITYTIEEVSVDDYTTVTAGDTDSGYTITNKVIAPKLSKEVAEDDYERKEDSGDNMHPGEDTGGDGWGSWDDADNNQEVTYHLKVSEIQNVANLTVHDYLEDGMDFEAETVEIALYDDGTETALTEGTDYTLTQGDCSDKDCPMAGCTFEVTFEDDLFKNVSSDAYLVITYKALTDTHEEDYDDYEDDLLNYSYMVFGTNLLSLRRSAVVTAETDLFGFGIYKYAEVDGSEVALAGAEFVLERSGMYATFDTETDEDTGEEYCMVSGWVEDKDSAGTLTSDDEGMIRIEGLDDDTYTITETKAPIGYDIVDETITVVIDEDGNVTVNGDTGSKEVVTGSVVNVENTLIVIDIDGTKTWDDADNQDGKRPSSITVRLLADGEEVDSATVTEADNWKWSFTDLPKYSEGKEISYSVVEDAVDDYSTTYDGYDITNSYTPGKTSLTVVKVWDDGNNADGIRPAGITVELLKDGVNTGRTIVLTADNNWTGSFTDLDEYTDGKLNVYAVQEVAVEGYTGTISGDAESGYVITNSHTPEKVNNPNSGNPNPNGGNPNTGNPTKGGKTGDVDLTYLWIILMCAAAAAVAAGVSLKTRQRVRK